MISQLLYWASWLALCFGVSSGSYLLIWIASHIWRSKKEVMEPESMTSNSGVLGLNSKMFRRRSDDGPWPVYLRSLLIVSGLVMAFLIGYAARDLRSYRTTYTITDVQILRRDGPSMYHVYSGGQQWVIKLCPDSRVDWDEGSTLKLLIYEERGTCKSVADPRLGYLTARDEIGKPIIRRVANEQ